MPWERLGGKVTSCQTGRLAVIYVRQSTKQQVIDHSESTRLQYALVDRAAAMGWAAARIIVIDDDLGKSGSSAVDRAGFQRLVSEISLGHVGLVLGTEMSRLARSGKDWYQLIELCALAGALLADLDGVYDPVQYNDRLLLGLKGTMSAAELHLIKQRMQAGRVSKARRGEMAIALPAGYARRPSGEAAFDPDEQVQAVVRLVFAKFAEIGTVQGVMRYLVEQGIEMGIRMRSGPLKGEIVWKRPARATITCMLHSPIYAGIYAYGRRRVDPMRQRPGHPGSGLRGHAEDEWLARIEGALPAYISVGQYRANLARLAANDPRAGTPGAVRYGPALLAGRQAKARRGELAIGLPTGYVRRASGEAVLDPDEQVQTVVRLIFAKFAELGTLHAVLRYLVDHDIQLGMRLHAGLDKGELVWRRPNRMTPGVHAAQPGLCGDLRLRAAPG